MHALPVRMQRKLATARQFVLAWGWVSSFKTCVPSFSSIFPDFSGGWWHDLVLTSLSWIIIPDFLQRTDWISHPDLGFWSMSTYMGNPTFIQSPPTPCQRAMFSSITSISKGVKWEAQCSLNCQMKLSISIHLYSSDGTLLSLFSGWKDKCKYVHISSYLCHNIPVALPSSTGGRNLLWFRADHNSLWNENSHLERSKTTPNYLKNSATSISSRFLLASCAFVRVTMWQSDLGGNIIKK